MQALDRRQLIAGNRSQAVLLYAPCPPMSIPYSLKKREREKDKTPQLSLQGLKDETAQREKGRERGQGGSPCPNLLDYCCIEYQVRGEGERP
jgi:hypothetical protein